MVGRARSGDCRRGSGSRCYGGGGGGWEGGILDASWVEISPPVELSFYISKSETQIGLSLRFLGRAFRPAGEGERFCRYSLLSPTSRLFCAPML